LARSLGVDPAVDLDLDVEVLLNDAARDRLDFLQLTGEEFLAAEAGVDAHHQHEVDVLEHVIEHLGRGRRIERHAGLLTERLDPLDRAVEVRPRLGMDGDDVRAGFGEGVEKSVDGRNHQMDVKRLLGVRAKRFDHRRADRQVGDEMPVHDVDVHPVGAGFVHRAHFLAKLREVSGKDRRRDERSGHGAISRYSVVRTRRAMKKPSRPPCCSRRLGRMRKRPTESG